MESIALLGVSIASVTMTEALQQLHTLLQDGRQHHVMTPNSEMLVAATRDAAFRAVLNAADFAVPDSVGLLWMARMTGQRLPVRIAGVDLLTRFLEELPAEHSVFLLGGGEGIAERAAVALRHGNPRLRIAGTYAGSPSPADAPAILAAIRAAAPAILLVAYGAPAQDVWIHEHLPSMPSVRLAAGVGGTFDFWAGQQRRAPAFLRAVGLEWLWRVLREPRRIGRIFTAVVLFPLLTLRYGRRAPGR